MCQIKRLNAPSWCAYEDENDKHDILGTGRAPVIPAVFGRDGWYYDRTEKRTWIEYRGVGYAYNDVAYFKYHVDRCYPHSLPREQVVRALVVLERENLLSRDQRRDLDVWREWMHIRRIRTSYYPWPGWAKTLR